MSLISEYAPDDATDLPEPTDIGPLGPGFAEWAWDPGDRSWESAAACRDAADTMFGFDSGTSTRGLDAAVERCQRCPVIEQCRERFESLPSAAQEFGIWFGTTPAERRDRRRSLLGKGYSERACAGCGQRFVGYGPSKWCSVECREAMRAQRSDEDRRRNAAAKRRSRSARRQLGLCAECGQAPHRPGVSTCASCAERRAAS